MHLKFFFFSEERYFGIILIICMVMAVVLTGFLAYHLRMAVNNVTTNESFKRDEHKYNLHNENKIIKELLKECEEWQPVKLDDGSMSELPPIRVDNEKMPLNKVARTKRYKELEKNCNQRYMRLTKETPYVAKASLWIAIKDIWNEE